MRFLVLLSFLSMFVFGNPIFTTMNVETDSFNSVHYGDPSGGCMSDEVAIKIQGVRGGVCTPSCSPETDECPQDKPEGCEAQPRCALENRGTGAKYCALMCNARVNCGPGASCKIIQGGVGICTYNDVADNNNA